MRQGVQVPESLLRLCPRRITLSSENFIDRDRERILLKKTNGAKYITVREDEDSAHDVTICGCMRTQVVEKRQLKTGGEDSAQEKESGDIQNEKNENHEW